MRAESFARVVEEAGEVRGIGRLFVLHERLEVLDFCLRIQVY